MGQTIRGALAGALGGVFALPAAAIQRAVIVYSPHRLAAVSPDDARASSTLASNEQPANLDVDASQASIADNGN